MQVMEKNSLQQPKSRRPPPGRRELPSPLTHLGPPSLTGLMREPHRGGGGSISAVMPIEKHEHPTLPQPSPGPETITRRERRASSQKRHYGRFKAGVEEEEELFLGMEVDFFFFAVFGNLKPCLMCNQRECVCERQRERERERERGKSTMVTTETKRDAPQHRRYRDQQPLVHSHYRCHGDRPGGCQPPPHALCLHGDSAAGRGGCPQTPLLPPIPLPQPPPSVLHQGIKK
ncbi:UNVERIFIED_CONTAM: hypothetical protein K2H54_014220 [Gekko kuhli]